MRLEQKTHECREHRSLERLNYHFGQLMTERDFRDQQQYYNEKRWMLNRFSIGWGVVHGLKVGLKQMHGENRVNNLPCVEIESGFALDQYGNEILVSNKTYLDLSVRIKNDTRNSSNSEDRANKTAFIALQYAEHGAEPFRLTDKHCCDIESECVYSRIRESYEFLVSENQWPDVADPMVCDDFGCQINSLRNLNNPAAKIIEDHPERIRCQPIPLAKIYLKKGHWIIDNFCTRPIAYSNYHLRSLLSCLDDQIWKVHAAGYDRRANVPLLAQTIPGLKYRDGRLTLREHFGETPFRITTDGTYLWCTDRDESVIQRIKIEDNSYDKIHLAQIHTEDEGEKKGNCDKKLSNRQLRGWGIAFDGHHMWVTLTECNKIAKINVCSCRVEYITMKNGTNPQEIVFDGNYLWISNAQGLREHDPEMRYSYGVDVNASDRQEHHNHHDSLPISITRLDPFSQEMKTFVIPSGDSGCSSSVTGMAFDGDSIWIIYNDLRSRAVAQPILVNQNNSEDNQIMTSDGDQIILRGDHARDISFDGTHIWVIHDEGASKIDIAEKAEIAATNDRGRLTSIAFDGNTMWVVQNRENESEIRRCDLYTLNHIGGYELRQLHDGIALGRICFDGTYIWLTGHKYGRKEDRGVIYRILP